MVQKKSKARFGIDQLNNPTPVILKKVVRIFFYTTSIATLVLDIFPEIPAHIKLIIATSVIKANLLVTGLSKLFGIEQTQIIPINKNTKP